jgi:hypothetical protein
MPGKAHLQDVLEFTSEAASTVRKISVSAKVPYLGAASVLAGAIVDIIRVGARNCSKLTTTDQTSPVVEVV